MWLLYTKIMDAKTTWDVLANPLYLANPSIKVSERNPLAKFLFARAGLFGKYNIICPFTSAYKYYSINSL
jgi:hypothetical protein